jgi:cation:H+ antiporter
LACPRWSSGCCCRQSRPNSREILNTILSLRAGKTRLALATISGAMMIQATVPPVSVCSSRVEVRRTAASYGVVTAAAVVYLLWMLRARKLTPIKLTAAAGFYAVFAAGLVFTA